MRVHDEVWRHDFFEAGFDLLRCLAGREAGSVGDAKDVRIDGDRRLPKSHVQDDIRGFSPHARQGLKRIPVSRNLAAEPPDVSTEGAIFS